MWLWLKKMISLHRLKPRLMFVTFSLNVSLYKIRKISKLFMLMDVFTVLCPPQLGSSSCCPHRGYVCPPRLTWLSLCNVTSLTQPSSGHGWVELDSSTLSHPGVCGQIPASTCLPTPIPPNSVSAVRRQRGAASVWTEPLDWLIHTCPWKNTGRWWLLEETCRRQSGASITSTLGGTNRWHHCAQRQVRGNSIGKGVQRMSWRGTERCLPIISTTLVGWYMFLHTSTFFMQNAYERIYVNPIYIGYYSFTKKCVYHK